MNDFDFNIERERKTLLEHGYREFPVRDKYKRADYAFQRRFRDERGTLYFITLWLYGPIDFPNGTTHYGGYMVDLHINEPFITFEQHEFNYATPENIAQWEARCKLFWVTMGCSYYERFDPDEGDNP